MLVIVPERQSLLVAATSIVANADSRAVRYAVAYARELRDMIFREEPDNAIHCQCLYVLNNIQHWRGDVAKSARAALKAYINAK